MLTDEIKSPMVSGPTLAHVWLAAMDVVSAPGVDIVRPLVATIVCFDDQSMPADSIAARQIANAYLESSDYPRIETTANLIFPKSFWNRDKSRNVLFARFEKAYPRIKAASRKNAYGTYFRRLTHYEGAPAGGNQLDHLVSMVESGITRGSALQAAIFDPRVDLAPQVSRGFPCLQQVMFTVDTGIVTVTGVYARQYIDARGYGNFLGLCWLGAFFAHEVRMALGSVTCIATAASLAQPKAYARQLISEARDALELS